MIALDIETFDPNLSTLGDGSIRKDGRILCCGCYGEFNGQHIEEVFDFDYPEQVEKLRDIMKSNESKIFHNGIGYDLPWLYCGYDMQINGVCHDTMTRAALIDERESLGLDDCSHRLGLRGKNKSETIEAWYADWQDTMKDVAKAAKKYGIMENGIVYDPTSDQSYKLSNEEIVAIAEGTYKKDVWANILFVWNDPSGRKKIKEYNLQDCKATYELFFAQEHLMKPLQRVYDLELRLTPILLKMKKTGIRFDEKRAQELIGKVSEKRQQVENKLIEFYGLTGEIISSPKKLGAKLNSMDIYSDVKTPAGNQSWGEGALVRIHHPVIPLIFEYKNYNAILTKFLEGSLARSIVNGRIHCTFLPMKREDGGTVTGRFSCRDPNLQQIPSRDKGHGEDFSQDMRSLFLPEEGQMLAADDYSQIEAVLLAHFAKGSQAEWFREQMRAGADLHNIVMGMTGITYRPVVKTFNYGCIYGMGPGTAMEKNYVLFDKLARQEGKDIETFTKEVYYNYHAKFPVIKDTMKWASEVGAMQGYIDTIGGRRQHKPKPQYNPATGRIDDYLYKMLNKLIQGTAADILKQALITAWDVGIYDVLTLHLLVHDEQVNSVPFTREGTEAAVELQHIMGDVYKEQLLVPIKAECELGPNWGYWSNDIYKEMQNGNFDPAFFEKDYKETH